MKKLRVLLLTLCVAVFMCGFTVTAYAGGGDEYIEPTEQWEDGRLDGLFINNGSISGT